MIPATRRLDPAHGAGRSLVGGLPLWLAPWAAVVAACSSAPTSLVQPPTQTPITTRPCGAGGPVSLSAYQGAVIDCSQGNAIVLAGGGARYLIVPEFTVTDTAEKAVAFNLGLQGTAAASAPATQPNLGARAASLEPPRPAAPNRAQVAFDLALRGRGRDLAARAARNTTRAAATSGARAVPALGTIRNFSVSADTLGVLYKTSTARLQFIGDNVLVYVDTLSPSGGFTSAQLTAFGQLFDRTLYQVDVGTFGAPTDIDANGHVIVLLTQYVNALTPTSGGCNGGFVGGFFDGTDLADLANPHSNAGEVFYTVVPDPSGKYGCALGLSLIEATVPPIFLHELQHMISFGRHVVVHGGDAEEGWLDEGLSLVAEEQGSRYYENKYPSPLGRTNPAQLFPDSAEAFIAEQLTDSYAWLLAQGSYSVTSHSDSDLGLEWRAGDWLLMRWLGDRQDSTVFARLDDSPLTGPANISSVMGEPFPQLFGEFGLALYTDSLPGVPRTAVPAQFRFRSRNLRQLYLAVYNAWYPNASYPYPFPIGLTQIGTGGQTSPKMVPGAPMFFLLNTATGASQVALTFTSSGGAQVPTELKPQVVVFRLPD